MRFGVAMIASIFHPSVGGIQTHTLRLSRKLRQKGVDAFVVTRPQNNRPSYEEIQGVPTYRVGIRRGGRALTATCYILEGLRLLAAQRGRWQIAHAHQMVSPMSLGLLAKSFLGNRLIINPHLGGKLGDVVTLQDERPLTGRFRLAAAVKLADAFVTISDEIRRELDSLGIEGDRIWEIPNGVDVEHFRPLQPGRRRRLREALNLPDGWLVGFAGRLTHQKGLDVLLEAWRRVVSARRDAQLILIGSGEELPNLFKQADSLGLERSVHFVGECSDVAPLLQACDAFVLPSRSEGLPVALLEAMAVGLPVVATKIDGIRYVLEDGVTGGLVPPDDPMALSNRLLEAADGARVQSWGERARRHVEAHYSLDVVAEQYVAMYEKILSLEHKSTPRAARAA